MANETVADNWEDDAEKLFNQNTVVDKRVEISFLPKARAVPSRSVPDLPWRWKGHGRGEDPRGGQNEVEGVCEGTCSTLYLRVIRR